MNDGCLQLTWKRQLSSPPVMQGQCKYNQYMFLLIFMANTKVKTRQSTTYVRYLMTHLISSTVHVYKRNLAHIYYNISSTFTATKLSLGTNNNNMLNYRSAKNHGYLWNSTFFRNLFFTKMCIIRAVTRNIHTQQIIILVTFHVLTIIDLSRTSILINQNYS